MHTFEPNQSKKIEVRLFKNYVWMNNQWLLNDLSGKDDW
jgi:hypothetical protein